MTILWVCSAFLAASPQRPDISAIEEQILEWANKERAARSLNQLSFSPDLRSLAEEHSRDMAHQRNLTHLSSQGKSYLDRLVEAGLFFIEIGENVAVSDTFDAEFIHRGFMESPEHRDNILNPKYDTVGIGAVYSEDHKYYITQDFCQSLKKFELDKAEKLITDEIAKIRKDSALPPLSIHNIANNFARSHARNKATGKPLQNLSGLFGETHIHFIKTPFLILPQDVSREIASKKYEIGAVGAWFGRLQNYPGGTYLITIFLFPISPYRGMKEEGLSKIVLESINAKRIALELDPIKLDRRQSEKASFISQRLQAKQTRWYIFREREVDSQVMSYETENPRVWPADFDSVIADKGLKRIGIGISSKENRETRRQTFWITLIF